jgi:multidrug efflux pump subunit AcrA (membrane-fusion protein)
LYDPSSLRLEVPVMARLAVGLRVGDELVVQIDDLNKRRIRATIDEVVPQADEATRSFLIKVKLPPSPDLFEGMSGRLLVPGEKRDHLCVHRDAIQTIGQLEYVTVLQDGIQERRLIKTGHVGDQDHVEVLSGLKARDKVVLYDFDGDAEDCRTDAPCGVAGPSEEQTPAVAQPPSSLDPPAGPADTEATSGRGTPSDKGTP